MMKLQVALLLAIVVLSGTSVEARGRRGGMYQQSYTPYYYNNYGNYNVAPAVTTTPVVTTTTTAATPATATPEAAPAATSTVVQANATAPSNTVVQTSGTTSSALGTVPTPGTAAPGSAQWKAEQSARMGSVAHIGGGFGGGSHEGNGFGFSPQQAITNACYWGQLTPIEIGVARGANGYYATIFYR